MTPQQLMDLPYAGMAERQVRKQDQWRLTDREIMYKMVEASQECVNKIADISGVEL